MEKKQTSLLEEEMEKMLEELSTEERQMLEEENAHLYKELQSNHEEVRQITRQVTHHNPSCFSFLSYYIICAI